MKIGGFQKISLSDYPGTICAVVFTQGCNFRCPYCHNPELVDPDRYSPLIDEAEVLAFLKKRRGKIEAVTLTGGEPTIQRDMKRFLSLLRKMGFRIKLDTNGSRPDVLKKIIDQELIQYVAMDLKGPLNHYGRIVCAKAQTADIIHSIDLIRSSGIEREFRTTAVLTLLNPDDVLETARLIAPTDRYILQTFVPSKTLDPAFLHEQPYPDEQLAKLIFYSCQKIVLLF